MSKPEGESLLSEKEKLQAESKGVENVELEMKPQSQEEIETVKETTSPPTLEAQETKKAKKEKKKKERQEAQSLTVGLNLLNRDEKSINDHMEIMFEDVFAEPEGTHSFDRTFRYSFLFFTTTRHWIYRVITALLAIPLAIVWAVVFALLAVVNAWIVTPLLAALGVVLFWVQKGMRLFVHNVFDPWFESIGKVFWNWRYQRMTPTEKDPVRVV